MRVPAKLNLQLAVGPPRADGYHDLVTVFHAVSLFDEIIAEPAGRDGVTVSGEGADRVPADQDNLALRAVAALRRRCLRAGVDITIAERIRGGRAGRRSGNAAAASSPATSSGTAASDSRSCRRSRRGRQRRGLARPAGPRWAAAGASGGPRRWARRRSTTRRPPSPTGYLSSTAARRGA